VQRSINEQRRVQKVERIAPLRIVGVGGLRFASPTLRAGKACGEISVMEMLAKKSTKHTKIALCDLRVLCGE
jgi:hypothetical protein